MKGVLQSPPSLRTGHLTAAMLGREMISPQASPPFPLTFDDESCPGQSSNLEAGSEGSWLGRWPRSGGGEDLVGSQEGQEGQQHQEHLQGERERGGELSVRPCQSSPTLHFLMSVATVVWCGPWS